MPRLVGVVKRGRLEDVRAALAGAEEDVDARDDDGWTALTSAAADGRSDLLELLLVSGADVNCPNRWGETALSRAVFGGHQEAARLLLDQGADVNCADEDGDSPLHVAVLSKQLKLVNLLLERGADVEARNKTGITAWGLACRDGLRAIAEAIQDYQQRGGGPEKVWRAVGDWVSSYWVAAVREPEGEAVVDATVGQAREGEEEEEEEEGLNVTTLLPVLLELCGGMEETQDVCEDMLERLRRVQTLLDEREGPPSSQTRARLHGITTRFHEFLAQHTKQPSVVRLASTRTILGLLRDFHCEIDAVIAPLTPVSSISILTNWRERWVDAVLEVENRLKSSWESNSSDLSRELPDTASQTGALLLLNSESLRHKASYSTQSQELLESASKRIARMSGAPIPEIPEWFVPRHEVQRQAKPFASGSYGQVYRGVWRGSRVVIKCVTVTSPLEKKAFLREARIWHRARHPHIVNFFGACYDCQPCFFVCEEAANGNLVDFLDKKKTEGRGLTWQKLLEAALGLEYLHQNGIVHGDLKCNQILVSGEGVAKLTDFGFSFVSSGSKPTGSGGAIRWRAPECLRCSGQTPTFESDVYSFGMCVVEALTYDVPWGVYLPDAAVMDHLRHRQFIPRPQQFTSDVEWSFVLALCAFEPSKRMNLTDAIKHLQVFAGVRTLTGEPLWIVPADAPTCRPPTDTSLKPVESARIDRRRQACAKIFYAVLSLVIRRRYLRFQHAVRTLQITFRYRVQRQKRKAHALYASSAHKVLSFLQMSPPRRKYLRCLNAVRTLQCRFRYRRMLRARAAEPVKMHRVAGTNTRKPETESTQSSWPTAAHVSTATPVSESTSQRTSVRRPTDSSLTATTRSPWVNDEERSDCFLCSKDFTIFRRKHHCRVCFEIICHNCSLTRKKMRVCIACAGLRVPPTTRTQTQRNLENSSGGFFTSLLTRLGTRRGRQEATTTYTPGSTQHERATVPTMTNASALSALEQPGLWTDDDITAARIPRSSITMQEVISRGAYGVVHRGLLKGVQVAIKTLLPESRKSIREINQFLAEAKMMATMEHPCIVNLVGVAWESLTDVCMVVEYMDGGDLRSLLGQYEKDKCPIGFNSDKLSIAMNVCEALTYLHSLSPPVLHRDLKSRNILLNRALQAKVTDFGVSREYVDQTMTAGVGTCLWMAPEVIMGMPYDAKADVFSFGIVLSELDKHSQPYLQESASIASGGQFSSGRPAVPAIRLMQGIATGSLRVTFSDMCPRAMVELGKACTALDPTERPTAAEAAYQLQCVLREFY